MTGEGKQAGGSLIELVAIVAVALGVALGIQAFLVKPFKIPSESMVPTLEIGQRVLVNRAGLHFGDPERGDVMVFKPPKGADSAICGTAHSSRQGCPKSTEGKSATNFIKRVVAVGGDRITIKAGRVYIDGKRQAEPFINPSTDCQVCNLPEEVKIPADHYYMMGDNRGQSSDSRDWGPVPRENMIGKAFATYWPPGKWGGL